jgi:hypothetical protein
MGSTLTNIVVLIVSLVLGIGVTYFGTSLIPGVDEQTQIILAIVISLFAFITFYFMAKSRGS